MKGVYSPWVEEFILLLGFLALLLAFDIPLFNQEEVITVWPSKAGFDKIPACVSV